MQTVNFNCPHCGNLMAVGTNLLGRNVRCPHCKQVVRAPAAAGEPLVQTPAPPPVPAPPPDTPTFDLPKPLEHHESIFGERHDEDLFGSEPLKPTLPPSEPPPVPKPSQAAETIAASPLPAVTAPAPAYVSSTAATLDFSPTSNGALENRTAERPISSGPAGHVDTVFRPRKAPGDSSTTPAFAWILLVYAAVVTIAAGFFGYQYFIAGPKEQHPYKAMPDVIREYKPAEKRQMSFQGMPDPKLDIPQELRVKLGGELTIGDLKVQPLYVEKIANIPATTKYVSAEDKKRPIGNALVLTMRVRNVSSDSMFCPNDPAFNRAFDRSQPAPYTALQIQQRYFYGTFKWPPETGTEKEYFVGHEGEELPLKPGEERDTWVTTAATGTRASDRSIKFLQELDPQDEVLLWRVQLRRGFVKMRDSSGQDVDISATAVIGVEFQRKDVKGL